MTTRGVRWRPDAERTILRVPSVKSDTKAPTAKVVQRAKALAPVGDTGRLRASIHLEEREDADGSFYYAVTYGVPYGGFVELGTVHIQARPYLRPALSLR